jgi:hypothetical protein
MESHMGIGPLNMVAKETWHGVARHPCSVTNKFYCQDDAAVLLSFQNL